MSNVHFGHVGKELPDWRNDDTLNTEADPDDEQVETPEDVVAVLGFDPADEAE